MAIIEQNVAAGPSFALTGGAEGAARPGARLRRERDPPQGGRVRRELDAPGGHHREGPRSRPHERPRAGGIRRARAVELRRHADGRGALLGCAGIAVSVVANSLGAGPVMLAGTDEQKRKWLVPLIESPILCSFGLTEPNAGSDVSGIQTTRRPRGRRVRINGSKMFITNAGMPRGSWSSPRPTRARGTGASPRSSCRPTSRG